MSIQQKFIKIVGIRISEVSWEGRRDGRLLSLGHRFKVGRTPFVVCQCDCGRIVCPGSGNLVKGDTTSCGCRLKEVTARRNYRHGLRHNPEYGVWCSIKSRCGLKTNPAYSDYGGRGIKMCREWEESFVSFMNDMGPKPSPKHTVERRNNGGNYEPGNCYWATRIEQNNNKRNNVRLTLDGIEKTVPEWARHVGISPGTLHTRLGNGWTAEKAVFTPLRVWSVKRARR